MDYSTINFERVIGYSPLRSIWSRLRSAATAAAVLCGTALGLSLSTLAAVLAVLAAAILIYKSTAILLCRMLRRHQVSFTLAMLLIGALSISMAVPAAVPIVMGALAIWLLRRSGDVTWRIA